MQIVCPNCATSYEINASSLGESGRMVRCLRCAETWRAQDPERVAADPALPSMWQDERSVADAASPRQDDTPGDFEAIAQDHVAAREDDVAFGSPSDVPEIDEAPPIAPESEYFAPAELDYQEPAAGPEPTPEPEAASPIAEEHPRAEEHDYRATRGRQKSRRAKPRKSFVTKPRAIAVLAAVLIAGVVERENITRIMPQMASFYAGIGLPVNLRGLAFEPIKSAVEQRDGVAVLVIDGAVRNITKAPVEVPRLRFAMRNAVGAEVYSWTSLPDRAVLPPGEVQTFRTRLASPPVEGHEIYVRFFQRRDVMAASQPKDR